LLGSVPYALKTVQYQTLTPVLLNEVQKQNAQVAGLKEQLDQERNENAAQKGQIESLQQRLARLEALLEKSTH
jgi:hypothetical protein